MKIISKTKKQLRDVEIGEVFKCPNMGNSTEAVYMRVWQKAEDQGHGKFVILATNKDNPGHTHTYAEHNAKYMSYEVTIYPDAGIVLGDPT